MRREFWQFWQFWQSFRSSSLAALGISPAGSRFAHARRTAQGGPGRIRTYNQQIASKIANPYEIRDFPLSPLGINGQI